MKKLIEENPNINLGNANLVPRDDWVDPKTITQNEKSLLTSSFLEKVFQKILTDFSPKHEIALVSLCTKTRPYSKSRKWIVFSSLFGDFCDLIVNSPAGVIPQQYWGSYPFLTYDLNHNKIQDKKLYVDVLSKRLCLFFSTCSYKKVILNFRPNILEYKVGKTLQKQLGEKQCIIIPEKHLYESIKKERFPFGKMFPDLDPRVLQEIKDAIL